MGLSWSPKDPDAVLDYKIDWSDWLAISGNDTIATSIWIVPAELTKDNDSIPTPTTTRIWLSGGVAAAEGEEVTIYKLVNRITTVGSRTQDQTVELKCKER